MGKIPLRPRADIKAIRLVCNPSFCLPRVSLIELYSQITLACKELQWRLNENELQDTLLLVFMNKMFSHHLGIVTGSPFVISVCILVVDSNNWECVSEVVTWMKAEQGWTSRCPSSCLCEWGVSLLLGNRQVLRWRPNNNKCWDAFSCLCQQAISFQCHGCHWNHQQTSSPSPYAANMQGMIISPYYKSLS